MDDHARFKSNQTAAAYVANALDPQTQEAFEMHLLSCPECLDDVEVWRALKRHLSRRAPEVREPAVPDRTSVHFGWRLAASVGAATLIGAAAGWYTRSLQELQLIDEQTAFFNLPATTRGAADCTAVPIGAEARFVIARVPGVEADRRVVASDLQGTELRAGRYAARLQADGSWAVRLDVTALGAPVNLQSVDAAGRTEPLGCITRAAPPAR